MADAHGHLNASSASISFWETFQEVDNHDGTFSYKTAHGKFMTAVRLRVKHTSVKRMEKTFETIYEDNDWEFGSGYGSLPQNTIGYRKFLQEFLEEHHIHSVVDVGCGDWQISRLMNWSAVNYLGIDIAKNIIEHDRRKYEETGVRFQQGSLTDELAVADLLIVREVLQHLPLDVIFRFLERNVFTGRFGYVLATNEMLKPGEVNADAKVNGQVPARGLNLSAAPFHVQGLEEVYRHGEVQTVLLSQPAKHQSFVAARRALGIVG
jgi:SAM-dependent methyltransferase